MHQARTAVCQDVELLDFPPAAQSETLCLAGGIIDRWQLRSRWYWGQAQGNVGQNVLKKTGKGIGFSGLRIRGEQIHAVARSRRIP